MRKIIGIISFCWITTSLFAQVRDFNQYVGLQPSFLVEPYDTINALEVNTLPFVLECKLGDTWGVHFRPVANYRFYKYQNGISQIGLTIMANKYFVSSKKEEQKMYFKIGPYSTYTYNRLDLIHTITVGVEPGVKLMLSEKMSLNVNLQPGINYYPDSFSQEFVETESGFKSHFGVIFHIGYNF